jgi:ribonuclease D
MRRRDFLGAAAAAVITLATRGALAGSYLDRAALMLEGGKKELEMVKTRTNDKELLLVVKALMEARLKVARKMNVPAKVVDAHPHLMLVLENQDRAVDALIAGNTKKYAECVISATDEEKTFKNLLKAAGYSLPKV